MHMRVYLLSDGNDSSLLENTMISIFTYYVKLVFSRDSQIELVEANIFLHVNFLEYDSSMLYEKRAM